MTEFILGIDDAGRGPVIGPMVLAGVLIDKKHESYFKKIGVKDSKKITSKRRAYLAEKIKEKAETFEILRIKPSEIDGNGYNRIKLNELEAIACAEIINRINKGFKKIKIVIDCPSTNLTKWKEFLIKKIKNLSNLEILCEHKADANHVAVSAASILAKETRELEMQKLKEIYGEEIGSGYTSDSLTIKFLEKNHKKLEDKGIFRKTWMTWKNTISKNEQKKLV